MDAIELSRQVAERLHASAVAAGQDPWRPYLFARAEAWRRGLEVEKVPREDVRLHGGHALYDPDALLILHEATGDAYTDAFLVAHEIGHVELGGETERWVSRNVDELRSSEAAPVGIDRVADYSRRQRREIQMDLFAREFLFPRTWALSLHVDGGKSATEIASQLGAPFGVVGQQLLDALLLPNVTTSEEEQPNSPLLPDQAAAASHDGSPFLLEASPGTGKTKTLVGRIDVLLRKGVEPSRILVLTFSNKAAGELASRVANNHPDAAPSIWIGTFHAFGLDLIRRFHDRLSLPADPRLIDRTDAVDSIEEEYPRLGLVHFKNLEDPSGPISEILAAISRANDEVVDAAGYRVFATNMEQKAISEKERDAARCHLEIANVFEAYEKLKIRNGWIDFGDLVSMPVRLCEAHADVRAIIASTYEHVLVDEYQDVNRSSVRLLKAITDGGRNLWAVGDVKQSIYRFRGASSFNMVRFGSGDFAGGARKPLTTNHRSTTEIVDTYMSFAAGMPSAVDAAALKAARGSSGKAPEHRFVEASDQEIPAIAEAIEEMKTAGHPYRKQAILCSGNDRLARIARGLERLGIPVMYLGSLFERDEIKELLCLLSVLVDRRAMGLVRVAAMEQFAISLSDIAILLTHLKDREIGPLEWMKELDGLSEMSQSGRDGLRSVGLALQGFPIVCDPWTVLTTFLLDRTRIAAGLFATSDVSRRSRGIAIWQFLNFVRTVPRGQGLPVTRLLERVRRLLLLTDERDLRQLPLAAQKLDAVRLLTIHGSKGLEFSVVHIPGMNEGTLPRSAGVLLSQAVVPPDGLIEGAEGTGTEVVKTALAEEQECLFFVALSRARDRLFTYSATNKLNGAVWGHSPFVERLRGRLAFRFVRPSLELPPAEGDVAVPLTVDGAFEFTDHQLGLYQRCPRRFFYTHVLQIGGRRTESAFMKLHVAVQRIVDKVRAKPEELPSIEQLEAFLEDVWKEHGPTKHSYGDEYKAIAKKLIRYYVDAVSQLKPRPALPLRLPIPGGVIVVSPDHVGMDAAGNVRMRRVRTGHKTSKEQESLAAAAFHLAANAHAPGCTVELIHLSDESITPVELKPVALRNRAKSLAEMGEAVLAGRFPLEEGPTCPRCPAFFVCGRLPEGPLIKKFSS